MMRSVNRSVGVQAQQQNPFLTIWNTENLSAGSSATKTITLPLSAAGGASYDFYVDWGDGTTGRVTSFADPDKTHVYADAGIKTVRIYGKLLRGWSFAGSGDRLKLLEVERWGRCFRFGSGAGISGFFQGCANLVIHATDKPTLDGVTTTMANAFNGCTSLDYVAGMDTWNMSAVLSIAGMFQGATIFNQDIGAWNTAAVTNMSNTFQSAAAFNQPIGTWNTGNVTTMANMFNGATAFNGDIGAWNTAKVANMNRMFLNCVNFNRNLGAWDVSKVAGTGSPSCMQEMFRGCTVFNNGGSADIDNWRPSLCTNMSYMFRDAPAFNQPIGSWTTGEVTTMSIMFNNASAFNQNIGAWDVSKVTAMANMFEGATAFNNGGSADINNWNTGAVTNMSLMFYKATAFNQNIGSWNTANVTTMGSMFFEATAFDQNIGSWNTGKVTSTSSMFRGISAGLPSPFNQNIGGWNVTVLTAAGTMFIYNQARLSTANYDALLIGWSAQAVQNNVAFHAGTSKYTAGGAAAAAKLHLTTAVGSGGHGWTITDGGFV